MEIKANELRLGNWVTNGEGVWLPVHEILEDGKLVCYPNNGTVKLRCVINNPQPIPLTEKWLLRFGIDHKKTIEKKGGNIEIELKSGHVVVLGSDSCTGGMCYFVECKFVHQLQNLYFCLTGEELTI